MAEYNPRERGIERLAAQMKKLQEQIDSLRSARRFGVAVYSGTGSPEGVVTASVGDLYCDKAGGAGTTLYVKESGTGDTGWVAK